MKILMFGWELPPFNSGGLGEACLGLTRALAKKGVKISFVLPKRQNINLDFMEILFADLPEVCAAYMKTFIGHAKDQKPISMIESTVVL